MDAEQESRWAAAQGIGIGEDLVPAALRQLEFLAAVDRRRWLYDGPLLHRAIRRYKACWLPLLAKHTKAAILADDEPLVVPLDCEWIWHCHRLNPNRYIKDCKRLYGRILDSNNVKSSVQAKSKDPSEKVWTELYPGEPFELEYTTESVYVGDGTAGGISYDLISAVKRQSSFVYQVGTPTMHDRRFLEDALARYKGFLYLIKMNQEKGTNLFRVPTYDVDLMWHTHQLNPLAYRDDMVGLLGRVLEHDDTDDDRAEGKKLDTGFSGTTEQFEDCFGVRYWKAGAMYRGSLPSPVTSVPRIEFGGEEDGVFGVDEAEKRLAVVETAVVELYLQIVDIKNLPSAIPEKSVYVWFTKTQPDALIGDGGRLDISSKIGKSIGAGFQCEPTGELILTVMVDLAYSGASSSKKSEPLGKVSISLQELTQHDSKLSFERWFELKSCGAYAGSPPVSLRVAASCTVPRQASQVLSMVNVKPCSLKACLLPHSTKDQDMSSWTRFVYDCGTELIRLQIREHKAKSGMALTQELVGVTKSSKHPFQLAEFTENKWSLNNSNPSVTHDLKPSKDGCIHELKYDNKLIKLYKGRRLAYELKCCSQHAEDTAAAVTAVKFSAEHPYGKAVALVDTESKFITVDEDWFLLPWIAMSFLFLNSIGKHGAKLIEGQPDTTVASEMVKGGAAGATAGPAQCGACGTAGGGDMVMASDKAGHASCAGSVIASGKVADSKCGGCGSGCGGGCGVSVVTMSYKKGHASCGVVAGGENGHIESAGCGSGCGGSCGGSMVIESSKEGNTKSGGCGSGCGGGGCGGMAIEGSKGGIAKPSGCGSGCGGSCGGMVVEGSKTGHAKSGGCGSGCGGGCGSMVIEGSKTGFTKSGGCGSGCGGGCGSMVMEGSKMSHAKSGGCGSGCGAGCGGGGCDGMVKEGSRMSHAKSGGCGSGCGAGCGGGGCGGMVMEGSKMSHAKSGGCGSGCGAGCGGGGCGRMIMEGSKMSHAKSGGCGSGCGAGCGGGGCGGMIMGD
ncbi:glycine-rich domain-containing protein 1-like isoform X4 [Hordeum vulgare subsp. vulgare]|uniref:glycine-rich domain-containing protein 1-like isoform X4 n=1 Tax=Hordeum vulgare subsp. vulgare TaxID=112509 RepID=UPI001D1A4D76|nr:glycine-rich domain-containing protein 1-like isoform X4 [Hordeum vulgare subsp. vulgare]